MTYTTQKNRVLIGKAGLDGHDRGAKVIARALRDHGFEVIYTGIRRTPEEIAAAAIQEDVAAIGLSSLSGAHLRLFPAVVEALRRAGAGDIRVLGGGVIPAEDIPLLQEAGIIEIFTPGTPLERIIAAFTEACASHRSGRSL
ncbi:MAG: cobalamin B12-binding domain-containing protein [Proteobacteria bacterium]|jgi:methylmalonyl-CoA mutase C-terminal domain/subunit|nr:cobalamin B12-binding domain-containing protein [Desulfocapsa sp.]MBU3945250.1 cobalamin B12-binding domain-containing protein [Pseudomonadota bacterium]MCG2742425.1 cobalamin B12-binding domain-containing protein [Desulfobacteraceae bacterium]MBU3983322.1 cobalamin B12-binding domain-containing protein [Pseudomonadota bacterium]MBU4084395.1 cobalamin B12-binding domain-containing protein [Pseudomonadota bacterium]